jgi:two-component system, cell cycle sensor histidine kinase and response regulator CckA
MTDVVMPEMNGLELSNLLLLRHPNLKRLFVSGYTADIITRQGIVEEGVHFIQKPISWQKIGGKLREVIENEFR